MSDERRVPQVIVAGGFQNGKSTLINCLLDDKYAPMGKGLSTTKCCCRFHFGEAEIAVVTRGDSEKTEVLDRREEIFSPEFHCSGKDQLEITCWKPVLKNADIIDTPGFGAETEDDSAAEAAIGRADLVVFVSENKALGSDAVKVLDKIRNRSKRMLFLVNCTDFEKWLPEDARNDKISGEIEAKLNNMGLDAFLFRIGGRRVWRFNPVFAWYAQGHLQRDLDSVQPQVIKGAESLIRKIDYFCREQGWCGADKKKKLLQASGVLEVRRTIEELTAAPLRRLQTNASGEIEHLTGLWSAHVRNIINGFAELKIR